ncbi:MAG: methyltransferase domain-containing protein [Gammaproteobacteria bacterium]|nr:methyltransferase domain-containing protein [Gammaproteobacteria bacterium]
MERNKVPYHRSVNEHRPDGFSVEDVVAAYDAEASRLKSEYERFSFEEIHSAVLDLVPDTSGFVLDIGAGTGRDASWFANKGYTVVAIEPSTELRKAGQKLHRSSNIQWMNDALPKLEQVFSSKLTFDLVWLSGVWMHVPKSQRDRAFRKIVSVLRPGGSVMVSIRIGPHPEGRPMDPVTVAEVETLAQRRGLQIVRVDRIRDALQRPEVSWDVIWLRFPDDGTGALPLLRHIVFNDSKSSTYKLALLRTLIRAADSAGGFARLSHDEQHVELPLGLVSLFWVRGFQPLLANDLPQHPAGNSGLSFVKEGFQGLASRSPYDLRVGQTFSGQDAINLIHALRDAAKCIRRMPANFITFPGSSGSVNSQVFPCEYKSVQVRDSVRIDKNFLWAFGTFSVPVHVWQAMSRYAPWIEPAVVNEWIEVMRS